MVSFQSACNILHNRTCLQAQNRLTCLWFAVGSSLSFLSFGGGGGGGSVCVCVCVCARVALPHRELSARSEPVAE